MKACDLPNGRGLFTIPSLLDNIWRHGALVTHGKCKDNRPSPYVIIYLYIHIRSIYMYAWLTVHRGIPLWGDS